MNFSQIVTDRIIPIITLLILLSLIYLTFFLAINDSLIGSISVGILACLVANFVFYDIKRILFN
jgi:hypothetical protein